MNPSEVKDLAGGLSQQPAEAEDSLIRNVALFDPGRMRTTRYRYRGAAIPTPWASTA